MKKIRLVFFSALLLASSCNKDDVIVDDGPQPPVITLDSDTGIYTVKVGRELTIAPTVEHADDAIVTWTLDNKIVSRQIVYTATWNEVGE